MIDLEDTTAGFAVQLRGALARSGLSLQQVVNTLAERGMPTTQATLSYWKSGRSLPRRKSSKPIVVELERILGLSKDTLIEALQQDLRAVGATRQASLLAPSSGSAPTPIGITDNDRWREFSPLIDWESDVRRETMSETITIRADRMSATRQIVCLARIPRTPAAAFHAGVFLNEDDVVPDGGPDLHGVEGATVGSIVTSDDGRSSVVRLDIPSGLRPGELHRIGFSYDYFSTQPLRQACERAFAWPLRLYTARVVFEATEADHRQIQYTHARADLRGRITHHVTSSMEVPVFAQAAQVTLENVTPSFGRFHW